MRSLENLLADITSDEDDDDITEYTSSEYVEPTSSDEGEEVEEEEREARETEEEDAAQALNAVADVQFVPAEMVGVSAADAHGEELRAEESEAVRREAAAAVAAAPAAVRLQVNEAMEEEEEEEDEAVERAQNEHDARAEEAEDVPANRDSQRMVNVDHLLATCIEPTAAANNILQRLMERAADESENIIEYAEHPCVKRRQQILDFLARPVEPEEMRYTRRSAGGLVTEHFFNQGNPRDRQINEQHNHSDDSSCSSSTTIFPLSTSSSNTNTSIESQDYEADESYFSIQVSRGQRRRIENSSSNNDDLSDYEQEDNQPSEENEEAEEEISEEDEKRSETDDNMNYQGVDEEKEDEDIQPPGNRFDIFQQNWHYISKYKIEGRRIVLKIRSPPKDGSINPIVWLELVIRSINPIVWLELVIRSINPIVWLELVIRDIYSYIISLCNENDMIGVSVRSLNFARGPGGLSLRLVNNFFYNDLWNLISGLAQSNEDFQIDESFILTLTLVNIPNGGRGGSRKRMSVDSLSQRSVISIRNNDNLCLPSIIVGEAFMMYKKLFSNEAIDTWNIVRGSRRGMQKERANLLTINANVVIPANGWVYEK
ncbi:myb-like protein X isoform X2 [Nasonia vitripennis]|uniref:Uncharacterized protein n=1 Tax=Nasonia vitripennis TaxID=7425 RepID=A0A7M7QB28_NASVI|nr:myb-like protein X isoform X2 [Nasonia vitripennis]